jgi:ribosomal protein S18 acetylase RimI-like enzyme
VIRRATPEDAAAIGQVFVRARDGMTYLPRISDEDRSKLGGWIVERHEVWVAEEDGAVVGFIGLEPGYLSHIYVDPAKQSRGIGTALLAHAKELLPEGMQLWVFQENEGARRLYERAGFRLVELTDGHGNMEQEPDARYEWAP